MRILQIHNHYRFSGGEEAVVRNTAWLLERHGLDVISFFRTSEGLDSSLWKRVRASCSSIYSRSAFLEVDGLLRETKPSIVHIHNLYPLISPSVIAACARVSVPVVMTLHNFRLICPIGVFFRNDEVCEACVGGREFSCVLNNCRGNVAESGAYALRTLVARQLRSFKDGVSAFVAPSRFLVQKYMNSGFDRSRFTVIPNCTPLPEESVRPENGDYAGYIGRFSPEKGVGVLLDAARQVPEMALLLAGDCSGMPQIKGYLPHNARLVGELKGNELKSYFRGARFIVVPSVCYEVCPMVVLESMSYGLPVIASNLGGLPEIIRDGETGLLFEAGNASDLASKLKTLWGNPALCERLGKTARERAKQIYSEEAFFDRLLSLYSSLCGRKI